MKLDATNVIFTMAKCHYLTFVGSACDLEAVGHRLSINYPRVITTDENVAMETTEEVIDFMLSIFDKIDNVGRSLYSVEDFIEVDKISTKSLANGLFAQADTKYWFLASIGVNDIEEQTCLTRYTGSRREHNLIEGFEIGQGKLIIAKNSYFGTKFLYKMYKIVGKGIIVINHCNFHREGMLTVTIVTIKSQVLSQ